MTKSWARIILFVRSFLPNNFTGNPVLCNWVNITPLSALLVLVLLTSCVSVKKFNEKLSTPVAAEKLNADVDYAYASLQELHPELYWYISKDRDRKSTRLNSSHVKISYAVFCLKKKNIKKA